MMHRLHTYLILPLMLDSNNFKSNTLGREQQKMKMPRKMAAAWGARFFHPKQQIAASFFDKANSDCHLRRAPVFHSLFLLRRRNAQLRAQSVTNE